MHEARKESCPSWKQKLNSCGELNHYAVMCKNKEQSKNKCGNKYSKKKKVHVVTQGNSSDSEKEDYVFSIEQREKNNSYTKKLFAKIAIRGCQLKCHLHCGSTVNILSNTDYMKVQDDPWLNTLENSEVRLLMYN